MEDDVTGAEVYLLTHSPAFQPFSYALPPDFKILPGEIVAVPFRNGFEAGVVSELKRLPNLDGAQIKPILAKLTVPASNTGFGKLLLALAHINLCSPGEMFNLAIWGEANRLYSLELSKGAIAPPLELQDAHKSALMLLGNRRARITPGLLKKLAKSASFNDLITLISCGSLALTGFIGLRAGGASAPSKARRQAQIFPEAGGAITVKEGCALAGEALHALGMPPGELKVGGRIDPDIKWRNLLLPEGFQRILLAGGGLKLALMPTQWHIQQLARAISRGRREAVFAFDPEMPAPKFRELEERLAAGKPLLVTGNRAAHFLMMHARFDEVIIFDPASEDYRAGQFPYYSVLADCLLLGAATSAKLTLLPQTPLPMGLYSAPLSAEVIPLPSQSGAKIDTITNVITSLASPRKQLLVFNNATGGSQEAHCAACGARVVCPQCAGPLAVDSPAGESVCRHCGKSETLGACRECGSKQLSIDIIGVEALAKRVQAQLRAEGVRPVPRVGILHRSRRERIRLPNLARTDVLIGTSTLFAPLHFYRPHAIVYVAQDTWKISQHGSPEEVIMEEASRLLSLYGTKATKLVILAPRGAAEAVKHNLGSGGWGSDIVALQRQYSLPPFNVQVGFAVYGASELAVRGFVEEMYGQLEFASEVLEWQQSRPLPHAGKWVVRGSVRLKRFAATRFAELRRRGKGKRIDLVFNPRYY